MNRLLHKTLFYYTLFAALILLLSTPFFYWMLQKLYTEDVDEAIELRKSEFEKVSQQALHVSNIDDWNRFNRDIRILPDTIKDLVKDHITEMQLYDNIAHEWEPYRVLYSTVTIDGRPYVLMIQINLVESEDLIKTIIWVYLCILLSLLLAIFLITRFISGRLWKPFYDTLRKIELYSVEQMLPPQFIRSNTREFEQLNLSIEQLMRNSMRSYAAQKVFTQNASHELHTPLAVLQSRLDLLLQDSSLTRQQAEIIQSLYESVSKLSRINRNLLLLAKIENSQYADTSAFSVREILNDVLPWLTEQAESKQLEINSSLSAPANITANKVLVEIMINNLLLNAIRHTDKKGVINLSLSEESFCISNSGSDRALDPVTLFNRFGKSATGIRGNGLGLAIVKEICDRYGWQTGYEYTGNFHQFIVRFRNSGNLPNPG